MCHQTDDDASNLQCGARERYKSDCYKINLARILKSSFNREKFSLRHNNRNNFYLSKWQRGNSVLPMLIIRIVLFLISLFIFIYSIVATGSHIKLYYIYLTHWGLTINVTMTAFGCIISLSEWCKSRRSRVVEIESLGVRALSKLLNSSSCKSSEEYEKISGREKIYWLLCNSAGPLALFISVFYWTVLHGQENAAQKQKIFVSVLTHAFNSLVVLTEVVTSSLPVRAAHVTHPVIFGMCYIFFGVFYHLAGGHNINGEPYVYKPVNWGAHPYKTLAIVTATVFMVIAMHFVLVAISTLRDALARRCMLGPSRLSRFNDGLIRRNPPREVEVCLEPNYH